MGLDSSVYIWNANTNKATKLYECEGNDAITAVKWNAKSNLLCVGESSGEAHVFDVENLKLVTTLASHAARVSSVSWNN